MKKPPNRWEIAGGVLAAAFGLSVIGFLIERHVESNGQTKKITATPTRCRLAPGSLTHAISFELNGATGIRFVRAVRSRDFQRPLYFVAGQLQGPGLGDAGSFAVWATTKLNGEGFVMSADAIAKQFSRFPRASGPYASADFTSDGYSDASDCSLHAAADAGQ